MPSRSSDQQPADPLYADEPNFYKVKTWTDDELHVERLLYAGRQLR
jgi:hypothetical protein